VAQAESTIAGVIDWSEVGRAVRRRRRDLGLPVADASRLAGFAKREWRDLEDGQGRRLGRSALRRVAEILDLDADGLASGRTDPPAAVATILEAEARADAAEAQAAEAAAHATAAGARADQADAALRTAKTRATKAAAAAKAADGRLARAEAASRAAEAKVQELQKKLAGANRTIANLRKKLDAAAAARAPAKAATAKRASSAKTATPPTKASRRAR
jgi:hypothetical protein